MREVLGKQVYSTLEEVVDPAHTALIVVDMQNDLVSLDRLSAKPGSPPPSSRRIIPSLQNLIAAGRSAGVRIVYIMVTNDVNRASAAPAWIYYSERESPTHGTFASNLKVCVEGTWGQQIIPELEPQSGDFIVEKRRLGGFWKTELDMVLRSNGIESVVVTGTATSGCVYDTAMGAFVYDYYTVIAPDCISGGDGFLHELGMALMLDRFDGPSSEEVITAWAATQAKLSPSASSG
jgi:nicotinamidase-related amidase